MAPVLRNVLLLAAVLTPSFAIPTTESQSLILHGQTHSRPVCHKSLFKKLRDSIIESIWDVPQKSKCHHSSIQSDHAATTNFRTKYGRDVVLRFKFTTEDEAKAFSEAVNILYLDVWDYSAEWVDVRIAKEMLPSFLNLLPQSLQNSHTPLMHDLAQSVYDTYPAASDTDAWRLRNVPTYKQQDVFFGNYQPLSVIYPWLKYIASMYSEHAEYFSIGKSAEGRDIPALRVSAPLRDQAPDDELQARRTILVVGGGHAREWISTSTVAYLAFNTATGYGQKHSPDITRILKHYDIVFVPVLNPDGYEYTWSTDRLWRKNRQATHLPFCPGIDLNRAFGFRWDGDNEVDNPCTESYAGEHAFQAVEAEALANWAYNQTKDNNIVFSAYLDLHSYSQQVLYPYSYSCNHDPPNLEDLEELGMDLAKAFRTTTGHRYGVTSACESQIAFVTDKDGKKVRSRIDGTNNNGGSSLDYFYDVLRVEFAYQIKLRDTGTYGFLLPKESIGPTGRETYEALISLGSYMLGNRGIESVDDAEELLPENTDVDTDFDVWKNQDPEFIFRTSSGSATTMKEDDDDDDNEWERVYDEELRRRK